MGRDSIFWAFIVVALLLAACTQVAEIKTIDQGKNEIKEIVTDINNSINRTEINNTVHGIIDEINNATENLTFNSTKNLTIPFVPTRNMTNDTKNETPPFVPMRNVTNETGFGAFEVTVWDVQRDKAVIDAKVSATPITTEQLKLARTSYTDSNGVADFSKLPYGPYNVSVKKTDYEPAYSTVTIDSALKTLKVNLLYYTSVQNPS